MRPAIEDRVLDSAIAFFARQGYSSVTVRAIASRAGATSAFIYRVFRSKKRLFEESLRRAAINLVKSRVPRSASAPEERPTVLLHSSALLVSQALTAPEWRQVALNAFVVACASPAGAPVEPQIAAHLRVIDFTEFRRPKASNNIK